MSDRPEDSSTMSARAAHEIVRRIATMQLPPGESFSEREIAEQLQLGKVPVREALQQLAATGLIAARTGSGYRVAPVTLRSVRDLFELWRIVETGAVAGVADRGIQPGVKEPLLAAAKAGPNEDPVAEVGFHRLVVAVSGNLPLAMSYVRAATEIERLLHLATSLGADLADRGDHDRLAKALIDGDAETARQVTLDHVSRLERAVMSALVSSDAMQGVNVAAPI